MRYIPTPLPGAFVIDLEIRGDERGFFARQFCTREASNAGINPHIAQINITLSARAGTLRGMHYQLEPHGETKMVRCLRGEIYDCILDLRPHSPTFGQSFGDVLTSANRRTMYVPKGFAHGLLTLTDDVEILYLMGSDYEPSSERGIRFNDPAFDIAWPSQPQEISAKDESWPAFDRAWHGIDTFVDLWPRQAPVPAG